MMLETFNKTDITIAIAYLSLIIPIVKYLFDKKNQMRDLRFQTYHQLIQKLVQWEVMEVDPIISDSDINGHLVSTSVFRTAKGNLYGMKVDRQVAVVFELINYPEYFDITFRIISELKNQWGTDVCNKRIVEEIDLTMKYIILYDTWYHTFLRLFFLKSLSIYLIHEKIYRKPYIY